MSAHLSEEEQIEAFKRWWQDNGKKTLAAVVLAAAGYVSWTVWTNHQESLAIAASKEYDKLMELIKPFDDKPLSDAKKSEAKALAAKLVDEHKASLYGDLAALTLAKFAVGEKDYAQAVSSLRRGVETSSDSATVELARLRLARALAAEGKVDEALGQLGSAVSDAFAGSYAEAKGDILLKENRLAEAHAAYQAALTALDKPGQANASPMQRSLLQFKLDNARPAGAQAPEPAQAPAAEAPASAEPAAAGAKE